MSDHIHFERRGQLGVIVLDRPKALNSLTWDMIRALSGKLCEWREDNAIQAVLVKAVPGRAFCAGGDILHVTEQVREKGVRSVVPFFEDEYRLNWRIKTFPKPYIALLDGITMGGGVGIAVHGRYRLGTEQTRFAMPETGIGFFPDVGGSHFLSRLPHQIGRYMALTGSSLNGAQTRHAGLTTHMINREDRDVLEASLAESGASAARVLEECGTANGEQEFSAMARQIEALFAGDDLLEVRDRLQNSDSPFAQRCYEDLSNKAPLSLSVAFQQLKRGAGLDFDDCMRMEYRIVNRALAWADFAEGVRALIVDKDRNPQWRHGSIDQVSDTEVGQVFAPLEDGDLTFHWHHNDKHEFAKMRF